MTTSTPDPLAHRLVWANGTFIPWHDARVSSLSHSMQRASLVFDVASFHNTPSGVAIFRLHEHAARLLRSCTIVGLSTAFDASALERAACECVARSGLGEGLVRLSAF